MRKAFASGTILVTLAACGHAPPTEVAAPEATTQPPVTTPPPATTQIARPDDTSEFAEVSQLINDAIAARQLPGAVVVIGHGGRVVFHQAYGLRKLPDEPGLDGSPAPAEPMTEDTIFDLASLTKPLATAPAIMQLVEQGSVLLDDPVQKYLPEFNPANDPVRAQVTVRMLLTHFSGEHPDVELNDPWGLTRTDRAEGLHRALTTPLVSKPGEVFRYSDMNFTILGALLERVTGQAEDDYVQQNIFGPLGMADTRFLPLAKACGPHTIRGVAIVWAPAGDASDACADGTWSTDLLSRIAPTARDDEPNSNAITNPDFGYLLRGTVHDTTTRRMGGVAGHAGLFSTAHDVSVFAQALLDRLTNRPSNFPLQQATLELMTTPQQPGHTAQQVDAANDATRTAIATKPNLEDPLLAPHYPAIAGQNLRGLGWDIDTSFSVPRGMVFPIGSVGHTGFTGTSIWIDPTSDTYVILLANSIHQRGSRPINPLRGDVATATARALGLN
jgi:CubicO group peptidase (beta-lactamase class C family)